MRVEDKGEYWEVDGGEWHIFKDGCIYESWLSFTELDASSCPPFIYDLRDSLMEELKEVK